MANQTQLLDRWGNPVQRNVLTEEVSAATIGGVRSPISGYPADGLNPVRLANILRAADQGDPVQYLELAELIEERDPHYVGVLGTRRRSVSQIEVTVEAASDAAADIEKADMVRDWLKRDELTEEMFNILDCIGKGYSFTEIIWDTSEGQWRPEKLEWRDPRWFRFNMRDLTTPMKIGEAGQEELLDPFKFIYCQIAAKSGLALRSGIARIAAWGWMFKAFSQRDWAIFTQTFGQPLRLGKFGAGASETDRATLFQAVANIAGDCAAIIPESMTIDFIESKTIGSSSDLYERRANWLDQQISKAVLGQTTSTDAISGGHAVSQEHRLVQQDIERADALALSAILNRDLIRPWVDLEYGPQKAYPRLKIARPEPEDLTQLSSSLSNLVPLGLRVQMSEVRERFGFKDPEEGAEILGELAQIPPPDAPATDPSEPDRSIKHLSSPIKHPEAQSGTLAAQSEGGALNRRSEARDPVEILSENLETELQPEFQKVMEQFEVMLDRAGTLEELREMFLAAFPDLAADEFTRKLAAGFVASFAGGALTAEEPDG